MLQLKNITKDYISGDSTVHALKGISINFRKSEFVSILGQSGCGKTTLLNIIGGLDRYTSGDLIINGKSTKQFKDKDWDAYRNYSIGFVFQSYNLIPHQTILSNVELALTISGASKKDISRVFNAETFIIGLISGLIGIGVTVLLTIPINSLIYKLTGVAVNVSLPAVAGVILVVISMILTIIAGLIPAKMASKKDPVEALRTE